MVKRKTDLAPVAIVLVALTLAAYFCYSAVQGELGVLARAEYVAERDALRAEYDLLATQIAQLENQTHRLSDGYLDLDLLDQQARDVLGWVRADEIVLQ